MNTQDRAVEKLTKDAEGLGSLQKEKDSINLDYRAAEKELRREIYARTLWAADTNDKTAALLKDFRASIRGDAIVNGLASRLEALVARHQAISKTIADTAAVMDEQGAAVCAEIHERAVRDYRAEIANAAKMLLPLYENNVGLAREAALHAPRCQAFFRRMPGAYSNFGSDALSRARGFANFIKRLTNSSN